MRFAWALCAWVSLSCAVRADDLHLLKVIYIYSVDLQEVNWHTSDESRVAAIREVSKSNTRITLEEFKPRDKFHVTVVVPFEKDFEYDVTGEDRRFKVWVDMQRKGYAKIELKKGDQDE